MNCFGRGDGYGEEKGIMGEPGIKNKPLTKERRAEIEDELSSWCKPRIALPAMIEDSISSEAYWREAVKNAKFKQDYDGTILCPFCEQPVDLNHAADCPWKLAQDA